MAILAGLVNSIPAKGVSSNPTPVCAGSNCTISFPFTGDSYQWTAPASGNYTFEVWGAQGGNAGYGGSVITYGGKGGYAKGSISLTSGQAINVYVGGQGAGDTPTATSVYVAGGFNGGGIGFIGSGTTDRRGAGGGGASDIRINGNALTDRVIVAGGGGGGAYYSGYGANYPGVGGGSVGGDGSTASYNTSSAYNGKGGTQSAGGVAGTANGGASPGTLGQGGASSNSFTGCSGGGGGYYGGGAAGGGMASGGGSGYVGGLTSTTLTSGASTMPDPSGGTTTGRSGNGFVKISYTMGTATISMGLAGGVTNVLKGQIIAITATVDYAGKLTFFADGKKIAGCVSMPTNVGIQTCNWKPTVQKSVTLMARIDPTGATGSSTSLLNISVIKRTGTR